MKSSYVVWRIVVIITTVIIHYLYTKRDFNRYLGHDVDLYVHSYYLIIIPVLFFLTFIKEVKIRWFFVLPYIVSVIAYIIIIPHCFLSSCKYIFDFPLTFFVIMFLSYVISNTWLISICIWMLYCLINPVFRVKNWYYIKCTLSRLLSKINQKTVFLILKK